MQCSERKSAEIKGKYKYRLAVVRSYEKGWCQVEREIESDSAYRLREK